ncbi:unnamed protein product [Didymodactylos carnosus]|uniref:Multifunctional fusion protein n=1 Tax=Didymodactylos carnosus TaxID=1234261 RepID=A0A814SHW0_9BILA|nr:unnamed protein product [Didymodactylos carnosus]CAF3911309.1 unnamed protein product [Didymodactylos carnosus]
MGHKSTKSSSGTCCKTPYLNYLVAATYLTRTAAPNNVETTPASDQLTIVEQPRQTTNDEGEYEVKQDRNLENLLIVWLDANIDKTEDNLLLKTKLRSVINYLKMFDNTAECVSFITTIREEKVFLIVSGSLSEETIPRIHLMPQLESIYIFCHDKWKHETWSEEYEKVRAVFVNIDDIFDQLKRDVQLCSNNLVSMDVISTSTTVPTDESTTTRNKLEALFLWSKVLVDILMQMDDEEQAKSEFIKECYLQYAGNLTELKIIEEFQQNYLPDKTHNRSRVCFQSSQAITWYTRDCFLYRMLNKALRAQDVDVLYKLRFFISDLHRQVEHFRSESLRNKTMKSRLVYRGNRMPSEEFEKLKQNIGGLLSFNHFLSTSTDRKVALAFASKSLNRPGIETVLFEIEVDIEINKSPFVNIEKLSYFKTEKEILFSIGTVFRIKAVKRLSNDMWNVRLRLTDEEDEHLKILMENIKEEIGGEVDCLLRLGNLMTIMGAFKKALKFYEILLLKNDASSKNNSVLYNQIGNAFLHEADSKHALEYFSKATEIELNSSVAPNWLALATIYANIATLYSNHGNYNYSEALRFYRGALEIRLSFLPLNHPDNATIYNNIGFVHIKQKEHSEALENLQNALKIQLHILPENHPSLAITYNNIGSVYTDLGQYSEAEQNYMKALNIYADVLEPNHPSLALTYNNIASVYINRGQYSEALQYFQKTLVTQLNTFSPGHPELATTYHNISIAHSRLENHLDALENTQKALEIQLKLLGSDCDDHPSLIPMYIILLFNMLS